MILALWVMMSSRRVRVRWYRVKTMGNRRQRGVALIAVMLTLARLGTQAAASSLRRNEDISPSMQVLAIKAVQVLFYGFVLITGIRALGFVLSGLALVSGAVGVGIVIIRIQAGPQGH